MIVHSNVTVSFDADKPAEYDRSIQFEKDNPDWIKQCTTRTISFTHESIQSIEVKEGEADDGCSTDS